MSAGRLLPDAVIVANTRRLNRFRDRASCENANEYVVTDDALSAVAADAQAVLAAKRRKKLDAPFGSRKRWELGQDVAYLEQLTDQLRHPSEANDHVRLTIASFQFDRTIRLRVPIDIRGWAFLDYVAYVLALPHTYVSGDLSVEVAFKYELLRIAVIPVPLQELPDADLDFRFHTVPMTWWFTESDDAVFACGRDFRGHPKWGRVEPSLIHPKSVFDRQLDESVSLRRAGVRDDEPLFLLVTLMIRNRQYEDEEASPRTFYDRSRPTSPGVLLSYLLEPAALPFRLAPQPAEKELLRDERLPEVCRQPWFVHLDRYAIVPESRDPEEDAPTE